MLNGVYRPKKRVDYKNSPNWELKGSRLGEMLPSQLQKQSWVAIYKINVNDASFCASQTSSTELEGARLPQCSDCTKRWRDISH